MYKKARAITFDGTSLSAFTLKRLGCACHMSKLPLPRVPVWLAAMAALGAANRTEAVVRARELGLI